MKKSRRLILSMLLIAGLKTNAQVCFQAHTDYFTGTGPALIVSGDFDHDGNKDIVIADQSDSNIEVYLGDGSGIFGVPALYTTATMPYSICTGDFNGDTYLDLALGNIMGGTMNVMLNDGAGGFGPAVSWGGNGNSSLTSGDFNSDGFID